MFALDSILDAPEAPICNLSDARDFTVAEIIAELDYKVGSLMDVHHAHDDGLSKRDYHDTVYRFIALAEAHCELASRTAR